MPQDTMPSLTMLAVAEQLTAAGLSVIPTLDKRPDGRLLPLDADGKAVWKPYQNSIATPEELARWFGPGQGIGIVGGAVSGGLTILDFDVRDGVCLFDTFSERVKDLAPGLLAHMPVVQSQSGGRHLYFRCSECAGPLDLATNKAGKKTIETKTQGGYCVAPRSAGYRTVHGSLTNVPTITPAERALLFAVARSYDEKPPMPPLETDSLPGAAYNARSSVADMERLLLSHGWQLLHTRHDGTRELRRPGKAAGSLSATLGQGGHTSLYVFTPNAPPFEANQGYAPFAIYANLEHGGQYAAAARQLIRDGYGGAKPRLAVVLDDAVPDEAPAPTDTARGALPFPVDALLSPTLIRWVTEAAIALDSPPDFPAWGALAACSGAIGMSRMLRVNNEWSESALLWVVLVGDPGTGKTPALGKAGAPLWDIQNRYITQHEQEQTQYKRALEQWEQSPRNQRGGKPKEPVPYRFLAADTTLEALTRILSLNDRGVLVIRDELAGWIESFGQYKKGSGQDRASWLGFWASSPVIIDRKTDNYTASLARPFTSVVGTIQPERLAGLMSGTNDGFNDRMLFVYPDAAPMNWTDASISDDATLAYTSLLGGLLELKMAKAGDLGSASFVPTRVKFTAEAQARFGEYFQAHRAEMVEPSLPARLLGAFAKMRSYAARFALITHTVLVEEGCITPGPVDVSIVDAAWRLAEYAKSHARRVYVMGGRDETDTRIDVVAGWIRANGGTATARDLMRQHIGGVKARSEAETLLETLVDRGLGSVDKVQVQGGLRVTFKLF